MDSQVLRKWNSTFGKKSAWCQISFYYYKQFLCFTVKHYIYVCFSPNSGREMRHFTHKRKENSHFIYVLSLICKFGRHQFFFYIWYRQPETATGEQVLVFTSTTDSNSVIQEVQGNIKLIWEQKSQFKQLKRLKIIIRSRNRNSPNKWI